MNETSVITTGGCQTEAQQQDSGGSGSPDGHADILARCDRASKLADSLNAGLPSEVFSVAPGDDANGEAAFYVTLTEPIGVLAKESDEATRQELVRTFHGLTSHVETAAADK